MDRLTYWNNKEKGSALPTTINDNGDTVDLETLCVKLAAYEDTGLEPSEIPTGLELANVYAAMQELRRYKDAEEQGRLVRLPCKAGDEVFNLVYCRKWCPYAGPMCYLCTRPNARAYTIHKYPFTYGMLEGWNKTLFLTREAAEAALAEMTDTANDWRELNEESNINNGDNLSNDTGVYRMPNRGKQSFS